ncbi:MAG: response regulator [Chloroflexi bacterium]|nr:response regulator [Chloroflexota bacterium]
MGQPLRMLVVEDSESDTLLLLRQLRMDGFDITHQRVDSAADLETALEKQDWDIVISDYVMPGFGGLAVLQLLRDRKLDIPCIIVSGKISDETAVAAMKAGARDYVMKDNVRRLSQVIHRELDEAETRSSRKRAEDTLKVREEELALTRQMDAIKDEFIGMVSHEIKTPLTILIGSLYTARASGLSAAESQELYDNAVGAAESLNNIVDNLLELSRSQARRLKLEKEASSLKETAESVIQKLQNKSSIHRIVADIPANIPAVPVDRLRAERILYNLVDNAIKYSPRGGRVTISARLQNNRVVVRVSDEGVGIPVEDRSRLFQSFERLETDASRTIEGIGLGLKVCSVLVQAHEGKIWVESEPGQGSTFCFTLPLKQPA